MSESARAHRTDEILSEIAGKGDFPATARAIARLRTVAPREDSNTLALATVIMQDPGLSTKVLRVVNSAFYRPRDTRVSTISRAILLLGFDSIRDLATGILLIDSLFSQGAGYAPLRENLRRGLHTALLSQALAERIGYPAREEAYLLGLFARLGHLWLAAHYCDEYAQALDLVEAEREIALDDAIRRVIGVKPRDLAGAILTHWDLPDSYVEHFRRQPARDDVRAVGATRLHAVVEAATAHTEAATPGGEPSPLWLMRAERTLGLRADTLTELVDRVDRAVREQVEALGLAAGDPPSRVGRATAAGTIQPRGGAAEAERSEAQVSPEGRNGGDGVIEPDRCLRAEASAAGARAPEAATAPGVDVAVEVAPGRGSAVAALPDLALATEIAAEVSRAVVEREPLPNVLATILEGISRSGRFPTVVLTLVNTAQDTLRARLAVGAGEDLAKIEVPLRRDGGMLAETALNRVPCVVEHGSAGLLVPAGAPPPRQDVASFVVLPLLVRERLLGVLLAARPASAAGVTSADLPIAQLFAQLACVACTAQHA